MIDLCLTVPHGHPDDDHRAPDIAKILRHSLVAEGYAVALFLNERSRFQTDGNRPAARDTPFRMDVAEAVRGGARLLVDLHSFPRGPDFWNEDIVLLHTPSVQAEAWLERYAALLRETATPLGLKVGIARARYCDDINIEARQLGHPEDALLLAEHARDADVAAHAACHAGAISALLRAEGRGLRGEGKR